METAGNNPVNTPVSAGPLGHILSVSGSQASVGLLPIRQVSSDEARTTVGRLIRIECGRTLVLGVITDMSM